MQQQQKGKKAISQILFSPKVNKTGQQQIIYKLPIEISGFQKWKQV